MNTSRSIGGLFLTFLLLANFAIYLAPQAYSQGVSASPIMRRNIVIDLGDGLTTDAQLTFPAVGKGPFPSVLLVHGSGPIDMDAYIPPEAAPEGKPVKLFLQMAEYLSERGFAVLRYNKRGVGLNDTILNRNVYLNITFQDLVQDAEKAVSVLKQQPEVDPSAITIIGHSEGTLIAPRIAINDPSTNNIVLMSAAAHSVYDIIYWQIVNRNIFYAENMFDTNQDGLLSIQEVMDAELRGELPPQSIIQNSTGTYDWYPGLDANNDGYFSITEEWQPLLTQAFAIITTSDPTSPFYDKWLQSQLTLKDTNLDIIGNVTASILILNGENDIQTPVQEAFLLEQRLTEINHPDHTLITYPSLGHSFYPAKGLNQPLGAIQDYTLADLAGWLKDSARHTSYTTAVIQTNERTIATLQNQLSNLNITLASRTQELEAANAMISNLEAQTKELNQSLQETQKDTEIIQNKLTSDLDAANLKISELTGDLKTQTQRLSQELQAAQIESANTTAQLTTDLDASSSKISALENQTKDLQSESSMLQTTLTQVEARNNELQSALDTSTNVSYIAIGVSAIAIIAALLYRRK